jgi:hypothetical protein
MRRSEAMLLDFFGRRMDSEGPPRVIPTLERACLREDRSWVSSFEKILVE